MIDGSSSPMHTQNATNAGIHVSISISPFIRVNGANSYTDVKLMQSLPSCCSHIKDRACDIVWP